MERIENNVNSYKIRLGDSGIIGRNFTIVVDVVLAIGRLCVAGVSGVARVTRVATITSELPVAQSRVEATVAESITLRLTIAMVLPDPRGNRVRTRSGLRRLW